MIKYGLILLSLLGFGGVFADEVSKAEKLTELMRVQGLYDMIEQQQTYCEAQAQSLDQQVMEKMEEDFPGMLSEETQLAFEQATTRFMGSVKASWTIAGAVSAWQNYYGNGVTEAELDQILAYYQSPIGQKDIQAAQAAMPKWGQYFAQKTQTTLQEAMQTYMNELDEIVNRPKRKAGR